MSEADIALYVIESLKNADVLDVIKKALAPNIEEINNTVAITVGAQMKRLVLKIEEQDEEIKRLRGRVIALEHAQDAQEQYSRRESLRFSGIPEVDGVEATEETVLEVINNTMQVVPLTIYYRLSITLLANGGFVPRPSHGMLQRHRSVKSVNAWDAREKKMSCHVQYCAAINCHNTRVKNPNLSMFTFPNPEKTEEGKER